MKKVLIIPSWYPTTGNEIVGSFFKEQVLLLYKNGIDLRVVYIIENEVSAFDYYFKYGFKNKLELLELKQDPVFLEGKLTILKKLKSKLKISAFTNAYHKAIGKITADGWNPDIIHAFSTQNAGVIAAKLHKKTRIPYYISEHNLFFNSRKGFEKNAFQNAHKTAVVSFHLMRHLLIQEIDANPVIIWNLLDEDAFQINRNTSQNHQFTITTVAYPQKIKDMETFFKAIHSFSKLNPGPFKVLVVGNDNYGGQNNASISRIESLAKSESVYEFCTFLPYVKRQNMSDLLNETDVFISTSISESFGIAAREAMLCGVPVISTRNGGIEDTLTKSHGILVNLRDHQAIAENTFKIQKKEVVFDSGTLRELIIQQSGKEAFLRNMKQFYND